MTKQKKIKIFADGADYSSIIKFNKINLIRGLTTNPSLMKKSGVKNYSEYAKKVLKKVKTKPISFEVFADNFEDIYLQAKKISTWGKNVYVKIPVTNTRGKGCYDVIKRLSDEKVKLNITAVYTAHQTYRILKNINKKTKVIISIFAGRMADVGKDPIPQLKESIKLSKNYDNVEILWASTREAYNYIQAKQIGCHIITIPPNIIEKIEKFGKSFKELTVETVKGFYKDAKSAKYKI